MCTSPSEASTPTTAGRHQLKRNFVVRLCCTDDGIMELAVRERFGTVPEQRPCRTHLETKQAEREILVCTNVPGSRSCGGRTPGGVPGAWR
jgi:hypothetical protein